MKPRSSRSLPVDEAAAQWAIRQREGLDPAAQCEFLVWLEEPGHREAYGRLGGMAEALVRARATGAATALVTQLRARQRRRRRWRGGILAAAASLALVAGLWFGPPGPAAPSGVESPVAQFEPLRRLPDGSIVELRPGAELAVRFDAQTRLVELSRGEALFRVEKDPARPFIVRAGGLDVRAVGTAFNVRLEAASVEVLVTEGRVHVLDTERRRSVLPADDGGAEAPLLLPGQRCVIALTAEGAPASEPPRVEVMRPEQVREVLAWRLPRLDFDGVRLGAAVDQLNAQNRLHLRLAEPALADLRLSGTFSPDDPETFARLVAATFGLNLQANATVIVLARE